MPGSRLVAVWPLQLPGPRTAALTVLAGRGDHAAAEPHSLLRGGGDQACREGGQAAAYRSAGRACSQATRWQRGLVCQLCASDTACANKATATTALLLWLCSPAVARISGARKPAAPSMAQRQWITCRAGRGGRSMPQHTSGAVFREEERCCSRKQSVA